ncbi:putative transmembrane protein [Candidatus Burkholderia humilis]|nr:putative transmembrane protein [Candidatus Burkholderia humilis]
MKKLSGVLVAVALGAGFVGVAQAHVSVGIGVGVPSYPVYAAPASVYVAPPVYYSPPPPPVVYAPPPAVVVGGYGGYGITGVRITVITATIGMDRVIGIVDSVNHGRSNMQEAMRTPHRFFYDVA